MARHCVIIGCRSKVLGETGYCRTHYFEQWKIGKKPEPKVKRWYARRKPLPDHLKRRARTWWVTDQEWEMMLNYLAVIRQIPEPEAARWRRKSKWGDEPYRSQKTVSTTDTEE